MNYWKSYIKLCSIADIGAITAMRLIEKFGNPDEVFNADKASLMQVEKVGEKIATSIIEARNNPDFCKELFSRMETIGVKYTPYVSLDYPQALAKITGKPIGIYSIGNIDFNAQPCIAIVGSRLCTAYGQITARKFASAFARAGFTVVSGMARGIDSFAHIGAMEAGGKTIAVLGCGADVIYPPENQNLYEQIKKSGAIVSEFKLGTRADKQTFPIRNRIVAGMCVATLVVESDIRGGSMITARLAGEFGRDVFAIPGQIDRRSSRGCHALIRDGATLVSTPEEVIDELKSSVQLDFSFEENTAQKASKALENKKPNIELSADEATIIKCLKNGITHVDEIAEGASMPISKCVATLTMLELKHLIKKTSSGSYTI